MLELSIKLDALALVAGEDIEAVDSEGWSELAEEVSYCIAAAQLGKSPRVD